MKSQSDIIVAKYRVVAQIYDNLFGALERMVFLNREKNPRRALQNKIPDDGRSIIDIGCGTGTQALMVAGAGNSVTGIDLSPHMLAVAKKKINRTGAKKISFRRMDATAIDFPDGSFDTAMTWFSLHEMGHDLMCAALKESHRVLKQDAPFYIVDYHYDENRIKNFFFKIYLMICYPKQVRDFLVIDWKSVLAQAGYRLESIQYYTISKMVCAVKLS